MSSAWRPHDGEDQLRRAIKFSPGTSTVIGKEEYFYDHGGTRAGVVTRNSTGTVTGVRVFIADTELELTGTGAFSKSYAHLSLGTPVARIERNAAGTSTIELQYQGIANNTLVALGPTGTVRSGFVYGPYGDVIQTSGTAVASQRRRFNDKFRDDLTGLTYYGARYYDNLALGWTQADPQYRFAPDAAWTEPRRANLYVFSGGNALRYLDPDGRDVIELAKWWLRKQPAGRLYDTGVQVYNLCNGDIRYSTFFDRVSANGLRVSGDILGAYYKIPGVSWLAHQVADEIDDRTRNRVRGMEEILDDMNDGRGAIASGPGGGSPRGGGVKLPPSSGQSHVPSAREIIEQGTVPGRNPGLRVAPGDMTAAEAMFQQLRDPTKAPTTPREGVTIADARGGGVLTLRAGGTAAGKGGGGQDQPRLELRGAPDAPDVKIIFGIPRSTGKSQ